MALAASWAVRVPSGNARTSTFKPRRVAAATNRSVLVIHHLYAISPRLNIPSFNVCLQVLRTSVEYGLSISQGMGVGSVLAAGQDDCLIGTSIQARSHAVHRPGLALRRLGRGRALPIQPIRATVRAHIGAPNVHRIAASAAHRHLACAEPAVSRSLICALWVVAARAQAGNMRG
jgi:hypothetical protein